MASYKSRTEKILYLSINGKVENKQNNILNVSNNTDNIDNIIIPTLPSFPKSTDAELSEDNIFNINDLPVDFIDLLPCADVQCGRFINPDEIHYADVQMNTSEFSNTELIPNENVSLNNKNVATLDDSFTNQIITETESDSNNLKRSISPKIPQKNKRSKKADDTQWVQIQNKRKREHGEKYIGRRKLPNNKCVFDVERSARRIKPSCNCKLSSNKNATLKCRSFNESHREKIFSQFWKNTWDEKRTIVKLLVRVGPALDNKHQINEVSRRSRSQYYHLRSASGELQRVCKTMFLNTLCIGQWTVSAWITESDERLNTENLVNNYGKKSSRNLKSNESSPRNILRSFLIDLPKLESHYCRASTSKLYLYPAWRTKMEVFREYQRKCNETPPLSVKTFMEVFNELNLGIHQPKKDQCDLCVGFRTKNISEDDYKTHRENKEAAREEKAKDKQESKFVYTMDLQSVLLAPSLKASALYYKTKLIVHNFTLYDLKTKDGYCFVWHKGEGGLSASEFSTIISYFIRSKIPSIQKNDEVILYSDGCGYQNRNNILSNALLLVAQEKKILVIQKYLEKGHTQMECDSMHSTIERKLRNREIYTPACYVDLIKTARLVPKPYDVLYLDHTFWNNFTNFGFYTSIRPGHQHGDPTVHDIRCIKYNPDLTIEYKVNYKSPWALLPRRCNNKNKISSIPVPLYNGR